MQLKTEKGITLVELLAILALTGVLLSVSMQFFMVNLNGMNHQNVRAQLQREVTMMIEVLNRETYSATNIVIDDSGENVVICQLDGQKTRFSLEENKFMQNNNQVASHLETLSFSTNEDEPNLLKVKLGLEMPNGRNSVNYEEVATFRLRNYEEESICGNEF